MESDAGTALHPLKKAPFAVSMGIILLMAVAYTILDTLQPHEPTLSILAFIPGTISILALLSAGFDRHECYLRFARLSRAGALALALTTVLLLPILSSSTAWGGWDWLPALVYAPASGLAQELYFRSGLLPALEKAFQGKKKAALIAHAVVFVGFHYRTFRAIPSVGPGIIVAAVLFLAGCGWGWQVQRDSTVVWAVVQHSFFLVLMSMFDWA